MRDLYGVTFDLGAADAFHAARARAITWALDRYPEARTSAGDAEADRRFEFGDVDRVDWWNLEPRDSDAIGWWMAFRHRANDDPTLAWRSAVELVRDTDGVHLTVRVGQESLAPVLRPAADTPGRPRIVRDLADGLDGFVDGVPVRSSPVAVRSDDVNGVVQLLLRPDRRLPVVIVTPSPDTARPLTSASRIANQLVGIAHVFAMQSSAATFELTTQIGKPLSVYEGALRVYWPGFQPGDDPFIHRLWLPHTVAAIDEREGMPRHLLRLIGSISSLRVPTDSRLRALQRQVDLERRQAEQAEWARVRAESQDLPAAFVDEFDRQAKRIEDLEFEKLELEDRVDELSQLNQELSRNFATVQLVQEAERREELEADPPTTIREAVERLDGDYPDAVVVLADAFDSASETRYPHVDRAWAAIRAIGGVARAWHDGTLGMDMASAFEGLGFKTGSVSDTALGVYTSEYTRTYQGERIQLRWHLKLGSGGSADSILRIYWDLDEDSKRFVIGHVGRHLPDSTTG